MRLRGKSALCIWHGASGNVAENGNDPGKYSLGSRRVRRGNDRSCKSILYYNVILRLPNGYDTWVTEDGGGLSQGQKQLLCNRACYAVQTAYADPR